MENKSNNNSEKNFIISGSMVEQQDKIVGDKEDNNSSSVINSQGMKNGCHGIAEQEQNKPSSPNENHSAIRTIKQENLALNSIESPNEPSVMETNPHISTIKNESTEDEKLKYSTKLAEMKVVREENERLKLLLARILKDYQSLQSHFVDILKHQEANNSNNEEDLNPKDDHNLNDRVDHDHDQLLVSLSLGRTSSNDGNNETTKSIENKITSGSESNVKDKHEGFNDKLVLALGSSSSSSRLSHDLATKSSVNLSSIDNNNNSFDDHDELKEVNPAAETAEIWPPSKALKAARPNDNDNGRDDDHEDGVSQMSPLKKARVSVRTRCDTPTMNDGCQWRKYGQKISKGNPCPRAYYRCTVSPSCPVRKQVQRCVEDMSILITTYEGTHNHPLPISATAMASTTAAAASMLQSRSTASSHLVTTSATSAPLSIQNYSLTNNNNIIINNRQSLSSSNIVQLPNHQLYLPNTTFSTYNSHPTVTLDLTLPNPNSTSSGIISSASSSLPRLPSTCLSFSSSSSSSLEIPNFMNTNNYFNNYGKMMNYQPRNYQIGSHHQQLLVTNQASSNLYQPYTNNIINGNSHNDQQSMMTETIAAATKAITSNPKFQSALAAALTSFVGNGGGSGSGV